MLRLYTFSGPEILQLVASTVVLATAFALPLSCSYFFDTFLVDCGEPGIQWGTLLFPALPVALFIVVVAFVLHELAHKLVAQYYGLWAEFRASMWGLGLALVVSATMGVVVASPGVVLIMAEPEPRAGDHADPQSYAQALRKHRRIAKRQAGVISVAGPLVNITFAAVAFPLWLATDQSPLFDVGLESVGNFFQLTLLINVVLAAFNMVPVRPLDGSKIVRWSVPAFVATWAAILGLGYLLFNGV